MGKSLGSSVMIWRFTGFICKRATWRQSAKGNLRWIAPVFFIIFIIIPLRQIRNMSLDASCSANRIAPWRSTIGRGGNRTFRSNNRISNNCYKISPVKVALRPVPKQLILKWGYLISLWRGMTSVFTWQGYYRNYGHAFSLVYTRAAIWQQCLEESAFHPEVNRGEYSRRCF